MCRFTDAQVRNSFEILDRETILKSGRKYWVCKRMQDIFFSALALIVLFPLMLFIAAVIYIDDPHGSPLYTQLRCGRDGKLFQFYKFRSMRVNAEKDLECLLKDNEADGSAFKMRKDPRLIHVGHFLRSIGADELPQLWNILKGDMSIVGPRPALPREVEQYNDYQKQRLYIQPGLTCYWQIQPARNSISFDEWVKLDIQYIKDRSFFVDWKIILQTVRTIFHADGI